MVSGKLNHGRIEGANYFLIQNSNSRYYDSAFRVILSAIPTTLKNLLKHHKSVIGCNTEVPARKMCVSSIIEAGRGKGRDGYITLILGGGSGPEVAISACLAEDGSAGLPGTGAGRHYYPRLNAAVKVWGYYGKGDLK